MAGYDSCKNSKATFAVLPSGSPSSVASKSCPLKSLVKRKSVPFTTPRVPNVVSGCLAFWILMILLVWGRMPNQTIWPQKGVITSLNIHYIHAVLTFSLKLLHTPY